MVWAQVDATLSCPLPSPTPCTGYNTLRNVLLQVWPVAQQQPVET